MKLLLAGFLLAPATIAACLFGCAANTGEPIEQPPEPVKGDSQQEKPVAKDKEQPILAFPTALVSTQPAAGWGTVKGKILWNVNKAPIPLAAVIMPPAGNPALPGCIQANKGKLPPDETWVVNKDNKGIKNVFVWLVDAEKKSLPINPDLKEIKVKQVEVDQPACHFIPHALALREGQVLLVKNSAPFAHNFKYSGNPEIPDNNGNPLIPPGGEVKLKLKADRLPIKIECSIHPWMSGWVRVYDHPYYAVTDENGAFEIKDAPPGNWRIMIWHGSAGWKDGAKGRNGDPVEIKSGAVTDLGGVVSFPTE